jgi:hypothetical protein
MAAGPLKNSSIWAYNPGMAWKQNRSLLILICCAGLDYCATPPVTFHKDIEPLLQVYCQNCHRPSEIGPMPLLTYQDTRPWAKAVKEAVLTGKMPPWFAESGVQHYSNDVSLNAAEIQKLSSWVDGRSRGRSEGRSSTTILRGGLEHWAARLGRRNAAGLSSSCSGDYRVHLHHPAK